MNRANQLTLLRVLFIPLYLVLWHLDFRWHNIAALAVFILASLTDLLDGQIARRKGLVTDFGKFMDPLADKVLVLTAMIWFCAMGRMPDWAVVVVIFREFAVSGLRLVAVEDGRVIAAGWSGKVKTASTMVCLCVMHVIWPPVMDTVVKWLCIAIIVVTTVYSGVEYFIKNWDAIDWKNI